MVRSTVAFGEIPTDEEYPTVKPGNNLLSRIPTQQAAAVVGEVVATHFRMPGTPDPTVRLRRLAVVSTWAATLGFGGVLLVLWMVFGLFTELPSWWYLPVMWLLGLIGLPCTVGAFGSLHHRRMPWALLSLATGTELLGFVVTAAS